MHNAQSTATRDTRSSGGQIGVQQQRTSRRVLEHCSATRSWSAQHSASGLGSDCADLRCIVSQLGSTDCSGRAGGSSLPDRIQCSAAIRDWTRASQSTATRGTQSPERRVRVRQHRTVTQREARQFYYTTATADTSLERQTSHAGMGGRRQPIASSKNGSRAFRRLFMAVTVMLWMWQGAVPGSG